MTVSDPPLRAEDVNLRSQLKPALMSSFCALGYSTAFRNWPRGVAIDLYCFMRHDVDGGNAAVHLAALEDNSSLLNMTTDDIICALDKANCDEEIVALSSFLPQVWTSSGLDEPGAVGIKPVLGLIKLAKSLRAKGHPVRTIELVAGTRILGVWHGAWSGIGPHPSGREAFFAQRDIDTATPIKRLTETLKEICLASRLNVGDDLQLALELEPGPLYVLNTDDSLKKLQDEITKEPLAGIVGFNLDIAHWQLAHLRSDVLDSRSSVLSNVVHAHISDHAKGHFGDIPIGDLGFELNSGTSVEERLEPFRKWLDLLADAWFGPLSQNRICGKSNFVSIEMEACQSLGALRQSVRALRGLLSE